MSGWFYSAAAKVGRGCPRTRVPQDAGAPGASLLGTWDTTNRTCEVTESYNSSLIHAPRRTKLQSPTITTNQEKNIMEKNEKEIAERIDAATAQLERALNWLEERHVELASEVKRISATVDSATSDRRTSELEAKLAAVERELAEVKAASAPTALNPLRRTLPAATSQMLAKHGIGEGPVDVRSLDAALTGLSLEQRVAVKSQLLRAGSIA